MQNLSDHVRIIAAGDAIAAASDTDEDSSRIDMSRAEGVVFIGKITDSVITGVAALQVEQNDADSDTGMAALSGAVATLTSGANDDLNGQMLIVDVYRPLKRWVQAVRTSLTANIAFGDLVAIVYGVGQRAVALAAAEGVKTVVASPDEA